MQRRNFLEFEYVGEHVAGLGEYQSNRLEAVLDRHEARHHALALVADLAQRRVVAVLAGLGQPHRERLETMEQRHFGLEARAVLLDDRSELGESHAAPLGVPGVICAHASRRGRSSLVISSSAAASPVAFTATSLELMYV